MPYFHLDDIVPSEPVPGYEGRFLHSENMTIANWNISEGAAFPAHAHAHEQISLVLEGKFELTIEGETKILSPGVVAIIPSNAVHHGKALTDCRLADIFYPVREDLK